RCSQTLLGGLFLLLGVGLAYWANQAAIMLLPLAYSLWAAASYHAYRTAPGIRRSSGLALLLVIGLLVGKLTVAYTPIWINQAVTQCIVPSRSMLPTLQVDDRMFVRNDRYYRPAVGDIVVFRPPTQALAELETTPDTLFVKRIIALTGQQVQVSQGQVYINQQPLVEPYIAQPAAYDWGPETVSPGAYFVLGDNRDQSADSHIWGFLPREDILGRAYKIYWPPSRVRSLLAK
ncbi:MAG: signal peptidase I, partial [Leptolyngbya sp. SIO4C1]|nr:signal peptidase I [Leptolyngbya sp. SIO4C1]